MTPCTAADEIALEPPDDQVDTVAASEKSESERRRAPRLSRDAVPGIGSVTLYPRDPAELLNISSSGLLVSCARRLMPDSFARFVLRGSEQELVVTGRVVRSQVRAIGGKQGVTYETAIQTDSALDLHRYGAAPSPEPPSNRRVHARIRGPFEGTCVTPDGELPITVSDLSEGGCFVAQPNGVRPGDRLSLRIDVPNSEPLLTAGEVVSSDPTQGFAVHFPSREEVLARALGSKTEPPSRATPAARSEGASESPTPAACLNDW